MAKGQKELQKESTARSKQQYAVGQTAQQNLISGTPAIQADNARIASRRKTIETGDYANDKNFVSNKDRLTAQNTQRQNALSLAPTGAGAIAMKYADPNQIALSQKISDNEFARDQAAMAEEDVRQFIAQTDLQEQGQIQRDIGINSSLMGEGFQQANYNMQQSAQIAAQRAAQMQQMIGMVAGGLASTLTGGMSGALGGGKGAGAGASTISSTATRPRWA